MTNWFDKAVDVFVRWLVCLWDPSAVWREILREDSTNSIKLKESLQLWAAISLLAFAILLPVYKLGGVKYDDAAFYMPYVIYVLLSQVTIVVGIHLSLRLYRVPSKFPETLALHTTTIGAYVPIISLLNSGLYAESFVAMKEWKASNLPLVEWASKIRFLFHQLEGLGALGVISSNVVTVAAAVLLCRAITEHYLPSREVAWASVAFASGFLLVLSYGLFVAPLYFVLVYLAL